MTSTLLEPGTLVWIAGGLYAIGYLVTNQIILRLLVLAGTIVYIWYYWVVADQPLWEAILISIILFSANLIGLGSLLMRSSKRSVPPRHRDLFERFFDTMPPGDFRRLVNRAGRVVLDAPQTLTREGQPVEALYFVVSGDLTVEKRGEIFSIPPGVFVGEIGYLTGQSASATTTLPKGAEVLVWEFNRLRLQTRRSPRFKLALEAMISRDLANKVAVAVAPKDLSEEVARRRQA